MAIAGWLGVTVEPLGDFGDRFGVGLRQRPDFRDGCDEVIVTEFGARVEGEFQAELYDLLDVGAGVAFGLLGEVVQVELIGLTLTQSQVDPEDLLAFRVCG